ncbi:sigma factor-like helix-turn-helix DNA-binding protein [Chitinophaga solisilvae]|uniref:sigma factor-like helix-turn-helix DNA-binding protein n=1 Tax=Chitinophaga solisilvae TaxID=1233460 RepID=UPI001F46D564|nr:sigma factor-like helix-turn-helix DNA-binding protein [Chitinophaga solisilvae]
MKKKRCLQASWDCLHYYRSAVDKNRIGNDPACYEAKMEKLIEQALPYLIPDKQEILYHYLEGKSKREIAAAVQCTYQDVRQALTSARKELRIFAGSLLAITALREQKTRIRMAEYYNCLGPDQALIVRQLASGMSFNRIATSLGLSLPEVTRQYHLAEIILKGISLF